MMNVMKKEKELLVCSICGSKDVQSLAWVDANTNEFINDCADQYSEPFYCCDCEDNTGLTYEEDWKSDNSQTCCANCGNDNYECPSRFVGIERYCDDCDTKEPEIIEYWQYLEKNREKEKTNDNEEI